MVFKKTLEFMKTHWMYYLTGIILVFGIKYIYSRSSCNELQWILAPTAWWVRLLSGIPFVFEPDAGYVNYSYRFIIASSCSGVQFIIISIATLVFSFVHRMKTVKRSFLWIILSVGFSYLFTIFINGFRIILSIYLPLYIRKPGLYNGWLTPERLHTMTGIAVYFTALFILYRMADRVSQKVACISRKCPDALCPAAPVSGPTPLALSPAAPLPGPKPPAHPLRSTLRQWISPVFWYFAIVLGLPFLNRAYEHNGGKFTEYALLMTAVCVAVLCLFSLGAVIWKQLFNRQRQGGSGTALRRWRKREQKL